MNTIHPHHALLAVLLLLLLCLPTARAIAVIPADSFEQRCEREMIPTIEVHAHRPGFVVHNTVSSRVLNTRGDAVRVGQSMMGLTASTTRAEISIDGAGLADAASGRECIAPKIEVDLSYQPLDVFVAREFHPASCAYRAVFAHELQHVKIYADSLPAIERTVRGALETRYGGRPLYAERGKALGTLQEQIDGWLRPLIKAELAKVDQLQLGLDSVDEAEKLSHSCQGEIAHLMGSSF